MYFTSIWGRRESEKYFYENVAFTFLQRTVGENQESDALQKAAMQRKLVMDEEMLMSWGDERFETSATNRKSSLYVISTDWVERNRIC